jgi:hypothetical protein
MDRQRRSARPGSVRVRVRWRVRVRVRVRVRKSRCFGLGLGVWRPRVLKAGGDASERR